MPAKVSKDSGGLRRQNNFHSHTKKLFAFFIFFHQCTMEFSRGYMIHICNRLNVEADVKIQGVSVKPDIKGICHSSHKTIILENSYFLLTKCVIDVNAH